MGRKKSILIVEDDRDVLNTLTEGLLLYGYHPETAFTGEEALHRLVKSQFGFVITDVVLSGMTGLELAEKVKHLSPNTIVITMTGFTNDFDYDKAIKAGASDFIKKPFTLRELLARMKLARIQQEILLIDDLTRLLNRRGFFALAQHQLKIARREKKGFYLLYVDLDQLKAINNVYGDAEGDKALLDIARVLKTSFREADIVARIGGDEFVILASEGAADTPELLIARLHNDIEVLNSTRKRDYRISISIGTAYFDPAKPYSLKKLQKEADKSMCGHKRSKIMPQIIRVVYKNKKYGLVAPSLLDKLIASGRVKMFLRSDGWATVGVSPLRGSAGMNDGKYNGVERRNQLKYST